MLPVFLVAEHRLNRPQLVDTFQPKLGLQGGVYEQQALFGRIQDRSGKVNNCNLHEACCSTLLTACNKAVIHR